MRRITEVEGLAPPAGPYSFATIANNEVKTAGQVGQLSDGRLITGGVEAEARQAMQNLERILGAAATGFDRVTFATIYLTDVERFGSVNEVFASFFEEGEYPARATVGVNALPLGAQVEISIVATPPDNI